MKDIVTLSLLLVSDNDNCYWQLLIAYEKDPILINKNKQVTLIFKMNSKYIEGKETFTRDNFNEYYKYNNPNTEHLFIYGPLTDSMYEDIENNMKTHISNNTQLVIHLQGENFLNKEGNDGDMIFGMESKGNLFKNSFNYQNCMKNAQKLRQLIQSTYECEAFTICCNSQSRVYEVNGEKFVWTNKDKTISPIKGGLPTIYLYLYEDISYRNLHQL